MIARWPQRVSGRRAAALVVLALLAVALTIALTRNDKTGPTRDSRVGAASGPSTAAPSGGASASSPPASAREQTTPNGSRPGAAEAAAVASNQSHANATGAATSGGSHNGSATQTPNQSPASQGSCFVTQVSAPGAAACADGWTMQPSPGP